MCYLADYVEVDSFHRGVERMGFIIPQGVMNEVLDIKQRTPFITPSSQHSEAIFLFQAVPHLFLPTHHASTNQQTAHPYASNANDAGSPSGASAPGPAPSQSAICSSRQSGYYVQGGDLPVNKNVREGLTALLLPMLGVRESGSHRTTQCRHTEASHE
jgi:hypothetical protein